MCLCRAQIMRNTFAPRIGNVLGPETRGQGERQRGGRGRNYERTLNFNAGIIRDARRYTRARETVDSFNNLLIIIRVEAIFQPCYLYSCFDKMCSRLGKELMSEG